VFEFSLPTPGVTLFPFVYLSPHPLSLSSRSQRQVSLFLSFFFFVLNEKKKDEEEEDDENIFVNQFRYRKQKKIIRKETKKNPILK